MKIGNQEFQVSGKTYIMGILNVTPDSFSDGGKFSDMDKALAHVEEMIAQGASIIDVGGESTRSGHTKISAEEEIRRVVPVIREIKAKFEIPVSLDTYRSETARAGIEAGADLINDVWGLKADRAMADVIAQSGAACCLMHNREQAVYTDFMSDVTADLAECIRLAEQAGIAEDKIMIDPGIGFGKTYEQNLELMNGLEELHMFGYPILLGTSRKSMIGNALGLPVGERLEGTIATSVVGVMKGCCFLRVHDVKENLRAARMTEAILHAWK